MPKRGMTKRFRIVAVVGEQVSKEIILVSIVRADQKSPWSIATSTNRKSNTEGQASARCQGRGHQCFREAAPRIVRLVRERKLKRSHFRYGQGIITFEPAFSWPVVVYTIRYFPKY